MLVSYLAQFLVGLNFTRRPAAPPRDPAARRAWLRDWYLSLLRPQADRYRERLIARYGRQRGSAVEYAEAFEISEYAAPLDDEARARLFPE